MTNQSRDALHRVSRYFRSLSGGRNDHVRLPPFSLMFDPSSPNRYRNYAFPDDGAEPDAATMAKLITAFEQRERTPRLEDLPALAPELEERLVECGFSREGELPLMLCTRATLQQGVLRDGAECQLALSAEALREAAEIQNAAYGADPATTADVDRLRRTVDSGGLVAVARGSDGTPIGSGLVSTPSEGIAEVAAVGVLEGERKQGIGAAITAFLADQALAKGIDMPFLMAAHEAEARIYSRIGFMPFATMLHIARERP